MGMMQAKQEAIAEVLSRAPVVPVLVVASAAEAVPLARALVAGGLPAIEITLRTPTALDAIRAVANEVEGAIPGAGTILAAAQLDEACEAGARFAVSPGMTPRLLDAAARHPLPLLPGAATASEVMALLDAGYRHQKFFPAEASGGVNLLKSFSSPFPAVRFCPTGGIDAGSAVRYLALPNVVAVGGSWVAPAERVAAGDWASVTALARRAFALREGA